MNSHVEGPMSQQQIRTTEQVEVLDERGIPLGRLTRPTDPLPFGPDKGTVYLQRELPPAA